MNAQDTAILKSVSVDATPEHAFRVFTEGFDSSWPRSHHIGKGPMVRAGIESGVGGRCYGEEADGTRCEWGQILVWEPPRRFVIAWQIGPLPTWHLEADLSKASEVEVRFIPEGDGRTRVELEHRHFERHGEGADAMRKGVDSEGGWTGLLKLFAEKAEQK